MEQEKLEKSFRPDLSNTKAKNAKLLSNKKKEDIIAKTVAKIESKKEEKPIDKKTNEKTGKKTKLVKATGEQQKGD